VQETRQEKGKAGERHSMKKTEGGRQVMIRRMPKKRILCERHDRREGRQEEKLHEKNVTGGRQVIEALEKSYVRWAVSLKGKANAIVAGL
jgi:hypothetical protein